MVTPPHMTPDELRAYGREQARDCGPNAWLAAMTEADWWCEAWLVERGRGKDDLRSLDQH